MADELGREIEEIAEAAKDLSLTIVHGTLDLGKLPVVEWDTRPASTWKAYLTLAKSLGCPFIVMERYEFDEEALEQLGPEEPDGEEAGEFEDEEDEPERDDEFEAKWEKMVQEHAGYYGSLYGLALYSFSGGVCHRYDRAATWYTKLTEAAEELKEEMEAAEAELEEEEIPELSDEEIEKIASELANNELFQKASNQNARRFALKKIYPKLVDDHYHQTTGIIDQAKGIFELEIKPEMEKALDNQIADLAKQSLNKDQIAKKLKVPLSRVKKVV
jgi:hypothetical protein